MRNGLPVVEDLLVRILGELNVSSTIGFLSNDFQDGGRDKEINGVLYRSIWWDDSSWRSEWRDVQVEPSPRGIIFLGLVCACVLTTCSTTCVTTVPWLWSDRSLACFVLA